MSAPSSVRPSYAAVLRVPYARRTFAAALAGRLSYGTVSIAVMLGFRTQAGAWVNTAVNAGSSGGSAAAGLLVGHLPLGLCFAASGAVTVVAAGLAGCLGRKSRGGGPRAPKWRGELRGQPQWARR